MEVYHLHQYMLMMLESGNFLVLNFLEELMKKDYYLQYVFFFKKKK